LAALAFLASAPAMGAMLQLDPATSTLEFTAIGKPGFLRINGKGAKIEGSADKSGNMLSGTFQTRLNDFVTGIDMRDEHMKKKYLETDKYPTAVLKWSVPTTTLNGAKEVAFKGMLLLHGIEKEVTGTATVDPAADHKQFGVDATFPLKLSDFKIDIPKYLGVTVAEEVEVHAHLTARGN